MSYNVYYDLAKFEANATLLYGEIERQIMLGGQIKLNGLV